MGKPFYQIMGIRSVEYIIANMFIDLSIQNINGTIEHNITLHEILNHAKANNEIVHISSFDLEDAFGYVSHDLIKHSLKRYHFPLNVITYITIVYSHLHGMVKTKHGNQIHFHSKMAYFKVA